jgi:hypothetical protein
MAMMLYRSVRRAAAPIVLVVLSTTFAYVATYAQQDDNLNQLNQQIE